MNRGTLTFKDIPTAMHDDIINLVDDYINQHQEEFMEQDIDVELI